MKKILTTLLLQPLAVIAGEKSDLPTLIPAYAEVPPTFWEQHHSAIIVVGAVAAAYVLFVLKTMLRSPSPVTLPAEVVARHALVKLRNEPEDGQLLSAVSQILRRCVSETFELPERELTTAEFCAAIGASPQAGTELAGVIASFLRECDVRKFSPANAAVPLGAVQRALELIERIEKHQSESTAQPATPQ